MGFYFFFLFKSGMFFEKVSKSEKQQLVRKIKYSERGDINLSYLEKKFHHYHKKIKATEYFSPMSESCNQ